jgi:type IV pilus assembly protein PilP
VIRHAATLVALSALALSVTGCEDDPPPPPPPAAPAAGAAGAAGGPGGPNRNARRNPADEPPPPMQITDTTFISDINRARDPFKSYFNTFVLNNRNIVDQVRDVKLGRYSLDDLRLVAVIIGTDSPYAMVVDPTRAGTVLRRGMYVGRQEFVQTPQGGYPTHWRVARIEPGRYHRGPSGEYEELGASVVFERSNALDSNAQVVERAITLSTGRAGAQTNATGPVIGPIPGLNGPTPGYLPTNLGGAGGGGGGSANGAILGTQAAVQQAVNGGPPPAPPQTTVVVQVPPQQPTAAPAPPSTAPPPVQVYNGSAAAPR